MILTRGPLLCCRLEGFWALGISTCPADTAESHGWLGEGLKQALQIRTSRQGACRPAEGCRPPSLYNATARDLLGGGGWEIIYLHPQFHTIGFPLPTPSWGGKARKAWKERLGTISVPVSRRLVAHPTSRALNNTRTVRVDDLSLMDPIELPED